MLNVRLLIVLLLCLFFGTVTAQKNVSYEKKWEEIEKLMQEKDLPETALLKTKELYQLAKTESNYPQQIKALIYWTQLEERKSKDPGVVTIKLLQNDCRSATEPVKALLHSLLAEAYFRYLQQNRWKIQQLKPIDQTNNNAIDTWSTKDFHKKIVAHYDSSLHQVSILASISLNELEALLLKGNARHLRPTLFDLLAHRALDYYEAEERLIAVEPDTFDASVSELFLPAPSFAVYPFSSKDSASPIYRAAKLYQQLLQLHLKDPSPSALLDVDIRRIRFAKRFSTHSENTGLYRTCLEELYQTYRNIPEGAMVAYLLGQSYADEAGTYDFKKFPVDDSSNPRWLYQKALNLCKPFAKTENPNEGSTQCQNLIQQIERKELFFQTEEVNIPNQPFRILVSYRNTPRLWFRIMQMNQDRFQATIKESWSEEGWRKLNQIQPMYHFSQNMPSTEDYQLHRTEIKIPALKKGTYVLLISASEDFSTVNNVMATQLIQVSNLSWILQNQKLYVLNRETGAPVQKAQVQIQKNVYNYSKGVYEKTPGPKYITKEDGSVTLPSQPSDQIQEYPEIVYELDTLSLETPIPFYLWNPNAIKNAEPPVRKTILFTDRSVFRPGQSVFFKGLLMETSADSNKTKIIPNAPVHVFLLNVNNQIIDSLKCTTNEFGSYNGHFVLPTSTLNGFFRISIASATGEQSFLVEAYKRPKFEVQMKPPAHAYKVKDTVRLKGIVQAYAGYGLQQVSVRYRVVRKAILPYPWLCYRWGWPVLKETEILTGKTQTNAKGEFQISFYATPDLTVRPELNPVFEYEVYADATDLNGETQNGKIEINAGYQALMLELKVPGDGNIPSDSLRFMEIYTKNYMQVFEPSKVMIQIHQLRSPDRLIRERLWEQPDQFIMDENSYRNDFPYDEYKDETTKESWKKTERILIDTFQTAENKNFSFKNIQWKPGWYIVEAETKDQYGTFIRQSLYFEVVQKDIQKPVSPQYIWLSSIPPIGKPGDVFKYTVGTGADPAYLIKTIQNAATGTTEQKTFQLQKTFQETKNISDQERGGFYIHYCFVKHNRFHQIRRQIFVPYTNQKLRIQYESFRDKTKPGSKEKWTIRIKEESGSKPEVEVQTALYDASLDVYHQNPWTTPSIYPAGSALLTWYTGGFQSLNGISGSFLPNAWNYWEKYYDRLPELSAGLYWMDARPVMADAMMMQTSKETEIRKENQGKSDTTALNKKRENQKESISVRKNFQETAFFFPSLKTDTSGRISFEFTMPDALTKWKWQLFGHTKDLLTVLDTKEIVTQKELMIEPALPRFVRSGDQFFATARITNLSNQDLSGEVLLELYGNNGELLTKQWIQTNTNQQKYICAKGSGTAVQFPIQVPDHFSGLLTYRFTTKAMQGNNAEFSDGEQSIIPVLPNEILVTETLPIHLKADDSVRLKWKSLEESKKSSTLKHQSFTVEYTTNPIWLAVQALPYLVQTNNESIEQRWNQFYAHALALNLTTHYPDIQNQIKVWYQQDSTAVLSALQKNEDLKAILLQESPWILQAEEESEQRRTIFKLLDTAFLNAELLSTIQAIIQQQTPNGGFCWFHGGKEDRYMTQYLLTGIGQLQKMGALPKSIQLQLQPVIEKALQYLDQQLLNDYHQIQKIKRSREIQAGYLLTEQLYMRSFFDSYSYHASSGKAYAFFLKKASRTWMKEDMYTRALLLHIFHRRKMQKPVLSILKSIKEYAVRDSVQGIYFREFNRTYGYRTSIEMQAVLIQALVETDKDTIFIEGLKTWLLQQKRNRQWINSKSTAAACYTLLLSGKPWLDHPANLQIQFGKNILTSDPLTKGSGYVRKSYAASEIKEDWWDIHIQTRSDAGYSSPIYGAFYWQYLEQLNNIKATKGNLSIEKEWLIEQKNKSGTALIKLNDTTKLQAGDQVYVRWIVRNDQLLDYVYLKDLRPGCLEPVNKTGVYRWQSGLSYYENIRDSGTDFFIDHLPAGTHILESSFYITHRGIFSGGSSVIQSLYTPEILSRTEGGQLYVK